MRSGTYWQPWPISRSFRDLGGEHSSLSVACLLSSRSLFEPKSGSRKHGIQCGPIGERTGLSFGVMPGASCI